MNRNLAFAITSTALLGALLVASSAFAQTTSTSQAHSWSGQGGSRSGMQAGMHPGVFGTVSAINGSTLTVSSKGFGNQASTTTTYSVDASNATVMKNNATSTLSVVAVGDTVMVQGTVSGQSVTATTIRDGVVPMGNMRGGFGGHASSTQMNFPQGNGEPVVGGTVSTISGSTVTITTQSGGNTYTIDASSATVDKGNATSSLSTIAVGDQILVQGTVNGNSVTASSIIDQGAAKTSSSSAPKGGMGGILGGIGSFFHKLFGFF